ncbi:unnamed protein product [Adineta steineri]|uniref:NAD(P)(+)--arginine ADP-ribosyltransferase n=1 Tax=Adineta steineri TaxID=433720 RepID=A0A818UHB5_9BILA|nr:unnamed protein product [Adineta steineri]
MASASTSTRVKWMWKANADPFSKSEPAEWKSYSDVENRIIEEAFQSGQSHAILDAYSINFKHRIQILNEDGNKQRPIKREIVNTADQYLREERFTFTPINPEQPFAGLYGWISPFIRATVKELNITEDQLPSKDDTVVPMIVERAAKGIIQEGKKIGKQCEAEHMAKELLKKKDEGMKEEDSLNKKETSRSFPAFTSCSRSRVAAEKFGNVLFIMTVKHAFTVDLKPFSQYPDEEEELLSPGVCFTIERVESGKTKNKHLIYLNLMQQYDQRDREQISESPSWLAARGGDARYDDLYLALGNYDNNPAFDDPAYNPDNLSVDDCLAAEHGREGPDGNWE